MDQMAFIDGGMGGMDIFCPTLWRLTRENNKFIIQGDSLSERSTQSMK